MKTKNCAEYNQDYEDEINRLNLEIAQLTDQVKRLSVAQRTLTELLFREQQQDVNLKKSTGKKGSKAETHRTKQTVFKIGDEVKVLSNHKQRRGIIGKIVGFRGKTQLIVTSPFEAEDFAVWKSNVAVLTPKDSDSQE